MELVVVYSEVAVLLGACDWMNWGNPWTGYVVSRPHLDRTAPTLKSILWDTKWPWIVPMENSHSLYESGIVTVLMVSINNIRHRDTPTLPISTWMSTELWIRDNPSVSSRNSQSNRTACPWSVLAEQKLPGRYLLHSATTPWQLRHAFAVAPWSRKWRRMPHASQ